MNNMEIKVSVKDIPEVIEQLEKAEKSINDLQQENKQLKEIIKEATRILNSAKNHYGNDGKNWALERVINLLGDKNE